jgi:hypothetical protein
MKITQVTYRTNVITDNNKFRSKHVEATASIEKGDDPEKVLIDLAHWVHKQLGIERAPTAPLRDLGDEE